ncbi:hypothetical protein TCAL_02298 [Tigriopus californicus]|uniref:NADH dehydrogenase [ubiquinone] 1 alpha subcomplex subunit 1 n=1 Tax=Tigriopus californicus TaxID=6832 RepID=A0A553NQI9_TIGCA|nr:hypothetical protein TCAL_02298 [Tigriopus californicus]
MWWTILPPMGIMAVVYGLAEPGIRAINRLSKDNNPYSRNFNNPLMLRGFKRDLSYSKPTFWTKLTGNPSSNGNPYFSQGLEAVKD